MNVSPGTTSQSIDIQVVDDSGLAVTGLVAATLPAISWSLAGNTAATAISLSDLSLITSAYSSGGVKERSGGFYRLDLPNAALTTAGDVTLIGDATGKHVLAEKIIVGGAVNTSQLAGQAVTAAAGVTFPTSVASPTNITAGTVTNLTNLPSIPANWITAAGITAAALNGKGDWLLSSSYTAPTNLTAAQIATGVWQDATAGDFLAIGSIGKSLYTSGIGPGSTNGLATAPSGNIYSANVVQWNGNGAVTSSGLPSVSVGEMQNGVLTPAALPATGFNYTHGISLSSDQGGPAVSITGSSFSGVSITSTGGGSALNVSGSSTGNSLSISNSGSGTALRVANTGSGAGISVTGSSTLAKSGDQMDLVNAPNATAVTALANGLLDLASAIDPTGGADTLRKAIRLVLAAAAGKISGAAGTTVTIRDTSDAKNRVVATVDSSGDRTALTYDLT